MSRPIKKRRVCHMPKTFSFSPPGGARLKSGAITLSIDEYEALRLIDLEDYTQDECARQMQIARTTVQAIYSSARKKTADAIVNAKRLEISGGDYRLCENYRENCGCSCGCTTCKKSGLRLRKKSDNVPE